MILYLFGGLEYLIDLGLIDALDIDEFLLGGHDDAGDGAKPTWLELGDICCIDAVLLQLLNLDEVGLLDLLVVGFDLFLDLLLLVLRFLFLLHGGGSQNIITYSSKMDC